MQDKLIELSAVEMCIQAFLPRSFLNDHPEEVLEVTTCHAVSIAKVDNNYASSKEMDNSNEIKQRTSVFDRIKPSTTQSSVFQRLSMATKEEENQCPTFTSTRTSAFKRLSISTLKKDQPSTSVFDRLKMTNDQQQREMKTLKFKDFIKARSNARLETSPCFTDFKDCIVTFPCPSLKVSSMISSYSSLKASSMLSHIQARKLHRCFLIFKLEGFINAFSYASSIQMQLRLLSKISMQQTFPHLKYVVAEKIFFSNMLQSRRSSSQICCSQENFHIKYVAAEKTIISNMLQLRRFSSQICYNREDRHLKYATAEKIFISDRLQ
ncbi:hypothetical protein E5676_scaffold360G00130 [Cucumis melo var. makuwa]|uniref:Gag protease polyprotein n=1 Tax=Cucumis melo var. makuwa TaxID=1194695 RepID=A0A5D3BJM6_CUCMM|nr:hypothetical protein E5676_scaffold360G00130 [Cucumis melo var. makuwa]